MKLWLIWKRLIEKKRDLNNNNNSYGSEKKLSKRDIGLPTNFRHMDPNLNEVARSDENRSSGLRADVSNLKKLLRLTGVVDEGVLTDRDGRQLIIDWFDNNGGFEAVMSEIGELL